MIDQGGHATRAIIFDEIGNIVCRAESAIKTITRGELEVEHDPAELLASVNLVIDQVYESLGADYSKIKKAGLATQRSSIACWNKKNGQALSPIISWQDRRCFKQIAQYENYAEFIHHSSGLYLNPHYGATKMRWCLDNLAEVKKCLDENALCVAPLASYILFHLLDEKPFAIDPANASRTLLMNYKSLNWEEELLTLFSVPKNVLPDIVFTRNTFGHIERHGHKIPLQICTGDQSAVIYSEGKLADDEVFVNAGTGAFIIKTCDEIPDLKKQKILTSIVYADQEHIEYVLEGTVNGAGRALLWFADQSGIQDYESHLDFWCASVSNPPVFINAISGIGSPFWIAESESYFSRESSEEDPEKPGNEEKFVAVLESIIFLAAENIKCIERVSSKISQIRIAGGLASSYEFCQKLANLLNCRVIRAHEQEATAKGVFYLLSAQTSHKSALCSAMFNPKNDQMLINRHRYWLEQMTNKFPV